MGNINDKKCVKAAISLNINFFSFTFLSEEFIRSNNDSTQKPPDKIVPKTHLILQG